MNVFSKQDTIDCKDFPKSTFVYQCIQEIGDHRLQGYWAISTFVYEFIQKTGHNRLQGVGY